MSASDQDTPTADAPEADEVRGTRGGRAAGTAPKAPGTPEPPASSEESEVPDGVRGEGLTPKQARRLRVAAASVLLVALAVVLVVRLASHTSVLVVGVYGLAMILCGIVIELSRNGRTRLGTWLLVGGLLTALALDWLVLP